MPASPLNRLHLKNFIQPVFRRYALLAVPEKRVKNYFLTVQFFPFKGWHEAGLKSKVRRN